MSDRQRDPAVVSRTMRAVRSKGTRPERLLRAELHQLGFRYRLHRRELPGCPDIVFPGQHLAVFVDGEFWHGRQWSDRGLPRLADAFHSNEAYWVAKITRNVARDRSVDERLRGMGWHILRVWAGDVEHDPTGAATRIAQTMNELRSTAGTR
jgi:DNA mismatch endonuclease (patch repair protein)